jgi:anoctamin-10
LPSINSALTSIATRLTNYENYRTEDQYELAQTQKTFVLNFITSFLPIILTAFVYVPFGGRIVPYLDVFRVVTAEGTSSFSLWSNQTAASQQTINSFYVDPARLRQEVVYLTVTAQVLSFGEEMILPHVKRVLLQKYRNYKNKSSEAAVRKRRYSEATNILLMDTPDESHFLTRIRNEAEADVYNVQDDILEMCIQFGYLTLFGVAWPLVPLGFLLNNWLELRGDFFKISSECQRPPPIRADTIGPWLDVLSFLSWLGTLSTAAIVHLYRSGSTEDVQLWSLLLTVFLAEQAYLALRFLVRTTLEKIGSDAARREEVRKYAVRKRYLETFSEEAAELSKRQKPRVRFNETTDIITPTKTSLGDDDDDYGSDSGFEKDDTGAHALRRRSERLKGAGAHHAASEVNDDEQDQPDAPFKGGLCRTDSGTLHDAERTMRFWSAQQTGQETIDAGVKLIKVLSSLGRSKKARASRLKQA